MILIATRRPGPGWFLTALLLLLPATLAAAISSPTRPAPEEHLLASAYSGGETLRYSISWMGIVKTGELEMEVRRLSPDSDRFAISVLAKSAGLLKMFYPVEDRFETIVRGRHRLPVRLTIDQKEGDRRNQKVTEYHQQAGEVIYTKNDAPPETFQVEGPVHNEFSSLFVLRTLPLEIGDEVMVPTFADQQRHEIQVAVNKRETTHSMFGEVRALLVEPQLAFQGLYEKAGSPRIWLTDDLYRIPIRIESKIKIGSLIAQLVEYRRDEPGATPME